MHFDSAGRPKSPSSRKSKMFDASGNSVVFSSSKKTLSRKTNTNEANDKRKSSEVSTPTACTPAPCDSQEAEETEASKSLLRHRPTFKEFEGKFKMSRGSRLVKSQSLDHDHDAPKGLGLPARPATPGSSLGAVKEKSGSGVRGVARRARDLVLLAHNPAASASSKPPPQSQPAEPTPVKSTSFMSRIFQR